MKDHRILSPRQEIAAEDKLFSALLELESISELRAFFLDLCTPAELQAMKDRWAVVQLLTDGMTYRAIHDKTGVSLTTIGRVARCLNGPDGGYKTAVSRLKGTDQ
ncbi:MAG: YerC/YecD family TrpR-related protein [Gammaproteobacteria bacterium]|nr:YerC/YecD family TrpR-related protein [Gammaproteobacteria bacterium]